jgi:hypothetical protein
MSRPGAKRTLKTRKRQLKHREETRRRHAKKEIPDPSRNLDKERDRPVTVADVTPHALPGHPKCRGKGVMANQVACACAMSRFLKAHPEIIIEVLDREHPERAAVFWPKPDSYDETKDA